MSAPLNLPEISTPLPWHSREWTRIGDQLAADQLPHALLLAGPEGLGKAVFATALSRLLLCHEPVDGLNCGHCSACNLSANGSHGDFRWLAPEEKSRLIKVEQVRSATDFVSRTASYGARKVLVLQPADAMNASSANALLKCLEEPAGET
ncbi:MAG: DNA polymerase III subunit delta', partial [Halieaceae bacterium]